MDFTSSIAMRQFSENTSVLECPRCGSEYLHHAGATFFDRREDGKEALVTRVKGASTRMQVEHNPKGNPSARRDGLAVAFWCEACSDQTDADDTIELTIAQHKGQTEIGWRFTKRKEDQ